MSESVPPRVPERITVRSCYDGPKVVWRVVDAPTPWRPWLEAEYAPVFMMREANERHDWRKRAMGDAKDALACGDNDAAWCALNRHEPGHSCRACAGEPVVYAPVSSGVAYLGSEEQDAVRRRMQAELDAAMEQGVSSGVDEEQLRRAIEWVEEAVEIRPESPVAQTALDVLRSMSRDPSPTEDHTLRHRHDCAVYLPHSEPCDCGAAVIRRTSDAVRAGGLDDRRAADTRPPDDPMVRVSEVVAFVRDCAAAVSTGFGASLLYEVADRIERRGGWHSDAKQS